MNKDQVFYVGQKAFIDKGGEVLILKLPNNMLDFPGGKIQEKEKNFNTALKREVKEETKLNIEVGLPFYCWSFELHEQHPQAGKKVFIVGFKCKYLNGEIKLSQEHKNYRWVNQNNYTQCDDGSEHFKALKNYFQSS